MIEALERVIKQAARLPEQEQRALARVIEQTLSDMRWEELLGRPESAEFLRELGREIEFRIREESARPQVAQPLQLID